MSLALRNNIAKIEFYSDEKNRLAVTIDTERLHIRSVEANEAEYERYALLFGDRNVMEKFATGEVKTKEDMQSRINNIWAKRWHERDPYSGLAIFRNDSDEFLGHVVLGHGDNPGESELAYLFHQAYWRKGYGSEAVAAVVNDYAPATIQEGYTLEGIKLNKILATARTDNPASWRILEKVGMQHISTDEKYNALRLHYAKSLS